LKSKDGSFRSKLEKKSIWKIPLMASNDVMLKSRLYCLATSCTTIGNNMQG